MQLEFNIKTINVLIMNTKKQQCIKDAYLKLISEEEFNKLDPDSDGWLFSSELLLLSVSGTVLDFKEGKQLMARPKSLAGIETNNNWISVSDKLPTILDADINGKVLILREMNDGQSVQDITIY